MMSCSFVTAAQAESYFEHTNEYYTKNQTNFDRWHGTLAEAYGLHGELSKEQFDKVLETINNAGRKRAGLDCTFSAPKSVSLATAKDEQTRLDMIESHQAAVKRAIDKIEMELLQTRSNGKTFNSRNAMVAEFLHTTARPTEHNHFIPDLDLHSHCVILNKTTADGKDLAQEFGKVNTKEMIKELGLTYRQELAKELQGKGYELEITDSRQGFFEIKGFDRHTIMEYSSRRKEILEAAQEHGITDMQKANKYSRNKKEAGAAEYEEILEQTKKDLFDSGKIKIERTVSNANDKHRIDGDSRELRLHEAEERQRGYRDSGESQGLTVFEGFEGKSSLQDLPRFGLDDESKRPNLLLSQSVFNRLAKFQSDKVRSHFVQCEEKRERLGRIDRIAADTLKTLSKEKYAFTIPDAKRRIMAAGVLEAVTADEAKAAMERAGLVKLGKIEHEGQKTKDVYVTTKENIDIEKAVLDRVQNGKGVITDKVLTIEESRAALDRVENKAKAAGKTDFVISKGEQGEAVHHILVSNDKYVAVDGLAGTGKTTMLERLKWVADEQHIDVKGICFTGKAADGLQNESGIESTTVHGFLNKLERGDMNREAQAQGYARGRVRTLVSKAQADMINRKNVHQHEQKGIKQEWDFSQVRHLPKGQREIWAVDEAGLVDMHLMNQLQRAAEARGAQVLLLGDPDQLPPVGAGEPMRQMEEKGMATAHLYDIRRQKDAELLKAVRESVQGDHIKTFEALEAKGNYREVQDKPARMNDIKAEMTAAPVDEYGKNLLLVSTNADRKAYNKAIRAEYVERGELEKGKSYKITVHDGEKDRQEKRDFAPKDRIIFTANDKRLGVMNGTMATIERIDGNQITARTDGKDGKEVTFDIEKYNSIDHSYAVTNYKAQGMTVDKVVADMSTRGAAQSRNALYVDISRARETAVVYTDNKEKLERQTKDFARKVTSKDFSKKIEAMRERGGITNNDRYKAPQDQGKTLESALAQIEKHTQAPAMVKTWEQNMEAKQIKQMRMQERQRAAEAAKAAEQARREKSSEITFSR